MVLLAELIVISLGLIVPRFGNGDFVSALTVYGSAYAVDLGKGGEHFVKLLGHILGGLENEQEEILEGICGTDDSDIVIRHLDLKGQIDGNAVNGNGITGDYFGGIGNDRSRTAEVVICKELYVAELLGKPFAGINIPAVLVCAVGILIFISNGKAVIIGKIL